jgi:hypothetical protein
MPLQDLDNTPLSREQKPENDISPSVTPIAYRFSNDPDSIQYAMKETETRAQPRICTTRYCVEKIRTLIALGEQVSKHNDDERSCYVGGRHKMSQILCSPPLPDLLDSCTSRGWRPY